METEGTKSGQKLYECTRARALADVWYSTRRDTIPPDESVIRWSRRRTAIELIYLTWSSSRMTGTNAHPPTRSRLRNHVNRRRSRLSNLFPRVSRLDEIKRVKKRPPPRARKTPALGRVFLHGGFPPRRFLRASVCLFSLFSVVVQHDEGIILPRVRIRRLWYSQRYGVHAQAS